MLIVGRPSGSERRRSTTALDRLPVGQIVMLGKLAVDAVTISGKFTPVWICCCASAISTGPI